MNQYLGFFANSVDPDQPASSEADWSGSTLFAIQLIYAVLHSLVDMKMTCFHLLKVASDGNFYLLFGENY